MAVMDAGQPLYKDVILAAIVEHPDENFPFRTAEQIAQTTGLHPHHVSALLRDLHDDGMILIAEPGSPFRDAVYAVTISGLIRAWRAVLAKESQGA